MSCICVILIIWVLMLRTKWLQFRCTVLSYAFYNERGKCRHKVNYLYYQSSFHVIFSSWVFWNVLNKYCIPNFAFCFPNLFVWSFSLLFRIYSKSHKISSNFPKYSVTIGIKIFHLFHGIKNVVMSIFKNIEIKI